MNDTTGKTSRLSVEFIMLVAFLNACAAISIDAMLPAVGQMARELGAENPNSRQFIITTFFATIGTSLCYTYKTISSTNISSI